VYLGSYRGSLSKQSVVYNNYYALSVASTDHNASYFVQDHDLKELARGSLGPGTQAVAAGLVSSPDVGVSWVTRVGLMFNVVTASGKLVKEQALNVTQGNVDAPAIMQMANGDFVVVWSQDQLDGESWGVFLCVVNRNAALVSGVIRANVFVQGPQFNPAVVGCEGGGFIVVWESKGFNNGLMLRKFSSSGQPLTEEHLLINDFYAREPMLRLGDVPTLTYLTKNSTTLTDDIMVQTFDAVGNPHVGQIKGNWGQTSTNKFSYSDSPGLAYSDSTLVVALQEERYDFSQSIRLVKLGSSGCSLAEVLVNWPAQGTWRVLEMSKTGEQMIAVMYAETTDQTLWLKSYQTPSPSVCAKENNDFSFQPWKKPEASDTEDGTSTTTIIVAVVVTVLGVSVVLIAAKIIHWIYKKREKSRLQALRNLMTPPASARGLQDSDMQSPNFRSVELSMNTPEILLSDSVSFNKRAKLNSLA
jgi:hypothetical protein